MAFYRSLQERAKDVVFGSDLRQSQSCQALSNAIEAKVIKRQKLHDRTAVLPAIGTIGVSSGFPAPFIPILEHAAALRGSASLCGSRKSLDGDNRGETVSLTYGAPRYW